MRPMVRAARPHFCWRLDQVVDRAVEEGATLAPLSWSPGANGLDVARRDLWPGWADLYPPAGRLSRRITSDTAKQITGPGETRRWTAIVVSPLFLPHAAGETQPSFLDRPGMREDGGELDRQARRQRLFGRDAVRDRNDAVVEFCA
jgi:hypothetical protein